MTESFDYIVIGGGTAGCVLANRLSADPGTTVLLLEAGKRSRSIWTRIPAGYFKTVFNPSLGWGYRTQPEGALNDRELSWPRGKLLGGTGAINGMVYIRGQAEDFDGWARAGNTGWAYEDLLPYFRRSERQASRNRPLADCWHGRGGEMTVSDYPDRHPLCAAFIAAAGDCGIQETTDFNGADQLGAGYYQITTRHGLRADTAAAFLRPVEARKNLTVRCNRTVTRIVTEDGTARTVIYRQAGGAVRVNARKEIILAAGAINSPQILQLSGIGEPAHLKSAGVGVVKALPGVGRNLQDHLQAQLVYRCLRPVSLNDEINRFWGKARLAARYLRTRSGPMAGGPAPAGAFACSETGRDRPDVQFHFLPVSMARPGIIDRFSGFSFNVCQLRPQSRGSVRIGSANPLEPPLIQANYLTEEIDRVTLIAGLRLGRRIASAPALSDFCGEEVRPSRDADTDQRLLDYIRSTASSLYHPAGTCQMGNGPDAVVDGELRVHGVGGLRVADASIMPTLTSGNTNAPTVMIAEKAADLILATH